MILLTYDDFSIAYDFEWSCEQCEEIFRTRSHDHVLKWAMLFADVL